MRFESRLGAKMRARTLHTFRVAAGLGGSYSQALEEVARDLGFRDWNTASARLPHTAEMPLKVGQRITGLYLKQTFVGRVHSLSQIADGQAWRITLDFDRAVDVVSWESFSAFRKRVQGTVSAHGVSWAQTSDWHPHLVLLQ